jgi:hypothetical protein
VKRVAGVVVSLLALTWSALAQARTVPLAHPPAGPTRAHPVATLPANGGVVGDGRRYAVIDLGDRLRVINTATGSAYLLVTPCSPESASFGRFLVACPQPDRTVRYSILDAHRRTLTVVPGATPRATLGPIGRHWIPSTGNSSVGEPIAVYINWRTGKRRGFPARNGCYVMRNIDTRDLRPPRGRPDPCATYWFDGLDSVSVARPKFALVLNHLGERTVLSRKGCTTACGPMIGGGRVTWVERTGDAIVLIRGYEVATRERPPPTACTRCPGRARTGARLPRLYGRPKAEAVALAHEQAPLAAQDHAAAAVRVSALP